jgi:hypothetical protein
VDFEDGWLRKSSFITKDEMIACQLTRTKLLPKRKNMKACQQTRNTFSQKCLKDNSKKKKKIVFVENY